MKNSPDFLPVFGKEPDKIISDEREEESFGAETVISQEHTGGEVSTSKEKIKISPTDSVGLESLRTELARAGFGKKERFIPMVAEKNVFKSRTETLGVKPPGKFRRWVHLALVGLGLFAGGKLQAADSSAQPKPDTVVGGVPVFKAPMQRSANTTTYEYKGEIRQPRTEAEKAKMLQARHALEAQATAARTEKSASVPAYGQYQQHNEIPPTNVLPRPEFNRERPVNTGNYPAYNEGQFPSTAGSQRQGDVQVIQGGYYEQQPTYPAYNDSYRGRYSNNVVPRMPSTIYYGVPPGGQIPTEKRKLFGQEFEAITRNSAMYGGDSHTRGGNRSGNDAPRRTKKPKSP